MELEKTNEILYYAETLADTFIQRWDIQARQGDDGSYISMKQPLSINDVMDHLEGKITLGAYLLDKDSQTRYVVFDADDEERFKSLSNLSSRLINKNIPAYFEQSRRGGHMWIFFSEPVDAGKARVFARRITEEVEIFPKQDRLADGPGSLIRLPFGIHRKSGKRYGFTNAYGRPVGATVREQIDFIAKAHTVPAEWIKTIQPKEPKRFEPNGLSLNIVDFIGQFVELKPTASGGVGNCPFHDDAHKSFGVNSKGYWQCFAGCGGGDAVRFYMKLKGLSYKEALEELKN